MWRRRPVTITFAVLNGFSYLMIQLFTGGGHIVLPALALTLPALLAVTVSSVAALQAGGGIAEEVNLGRVPVHGAPGPARRGAVPAMTTPARPATSPAASRFLTAPGNEIRKGVKLFWRLLGEIQSGTIEQACLSPLPSWLAAAAGRLIAAIIETLILMGVTYGLVSAFVTVHFHWTAAALVPMAFLILSGTGYSLIMAGMTLLRKRIQLLMDALLMLVMIFAVAALPVITVPGWLTGLGRVFPVTADVASRYAVMLGGRGVTGRWGTGGLVWVVVTAAAYLAAGLVVFRILERITKARGALAAY